MSFIFKLGKQTTLHILEKSDSQHLDISKSGDATHDKISQAGECFVLELYEASSRPTSMTLDAFRYIFYMQKMKKVLKMKSSSFFSFRFESLRYKNG